ncbi:MAG TPA: YihY/virulence factor BrkB family protein [Candidatus Limenecus avicola]|uniref:YihY/virulence factor BrkB family protein n=1 Tax=Candidatus Limenecus avicola TaxID=2840847 RepID=A0A9D1N1T6_9CLOT|nr:YihY/virulence factor BrkB family protein [Candidatus Limenecus avicola]
MNIIIEKTVNYLKNLINRIIIDDFMGMAAEMGFWFAIGIFPFMLFMMSFFSIMGKKSLFTPIIAFLDSVAPTDSVNLIKEVLNEVLIFEHGGIVAVFGFFITVFLSSNAIFCIIKGLNRALGIDEHRNLISTRILSILMVFVNVFVMFITINLIIFGKVLVQFALNFINIPLGAINIFLVSRWFVSFIALYIMAYLNYFLLPAWQGSDKIKSKSSLPGTLFFCFCWMFGSWCFSLYINNLHTYNRVYGSIGAFVMLMVWLYYTSLILLVGGEVNSQAYRRLNSK